eukprot:TRINITY_DN55556_c0_g1_i1.p2 TRINITY_DN55556_c0_g1~~TRINITY_DN55556_c0_g1_i1.p2  ORF type:complete len:268 (+),score=109.63 TRINITY_DN55556_c0_g1_i1:104-805(+)
MDGSAYSFSLTTFSPQGKLVQIEHAMAAVQSGHTTLGIKATDGVILVTEKRIPALADGKDFRKMQMLDDHVGLIYAGMNADMRLHAAEARRACQRYRMQYAEPIPVGQLVREIASVMQEYTQSGGVRPFGVSLLVAGYDTMGYHLYQVDPSGLFIPWKATAIGKGAANAKSYLEKRYAADTHLEDATHTALRTLKEGFDGQMKSTNIEVARVENGKFTVLDETDVQEYLDEMQ